MKTLAKRLFVFILSVALFVGCKKKDVVQPSNNSTLPPAVSYMDTTVNFDFVIQAPNALYQSFGIDTYNDLSQVNSVTETGISMTSSSSGSYIDIHQQVNLYSGTPPDTSTLNPVIHLPLSIKFSKSYNAHILIGLQTNDQSNLPVFYDAQFDYNAATRTFGSIVYPTSGPTTAQEDSMHVGLDPQTGVTMKPKEWLIYCKLQ